MTARALSHPPGLKGLRLPLALAAPPGWAVALLMLAAAILVRMPDFGNPAIQVDEQFYLLVGDRMLHGQLPYIDIWDRKPIGLFLIYAAIRLLGGTGILQYQIVAAGFAAATAWLISRVARGIAGEWPAIAAGLCYLLWIGTVGGTGGQAPIFYNLPMLGAAALVLRSLQAESEREVRRLALGAMALVGVALQIKYTAAIEGIFFGLVLVWRAARLATPRAAIRLGIGCATIAAVPTMLAFGYFARLGAAHAFLYANFQSIALRGTTPNGGTRLIIDLQHSILLGLCCAASWWQLRNETRQLVRQWRLFMLGWLGAALLGFLCVGAYFYHYLLPVYLPLSIGAAPIFRRRLIGPVLAGIAIWLPLSANDWPSDHNRADAQAMTAALMAAIPSGVDRGCMQMLDGPPSLYLLTHACLASRWPFPNHLMSAVEAGAIGVDPAAEMRRLMRARPLVVVAPRVIGDDGAAAKILRDGLARSYRITGTALYEERPLSVYVRR